MVGIEEFTTYSTSSKREGFKRAGIERGIDNWN